jgi:hypothetical protein
LFAFFFFFSIVSCALFFSESYIKYNVIPRIQKLKSVGGGRPFYEVVESDTICFFRARADESVWIDDCGGPPKKALPSIVQNMNPNRKALVETTLGRKCGAIRKFRRPDATVVYLNCSSS